MRRNELRTSYLPQTGAPLYLLWTLFCPLLILVSTQEPLHDSSPTLWQPIVREGTSTAAATPWLIGRGRVSRSFVDCLDRPLHWIGLQLIWLPVWAAIIIPAVYWPRHIIYSLLGETYHHAPRGIVFKFGLLKGPWLGILFGFESLARIQSERERSLVGRMHSPRHTFYGSKRSRNRIFCSTR